MDIMGRVDDSLATVQETTIDAGLTMIDMRPFLDETSQVITQDIPTAFDDVQAAMPNLIEAAALVDNALRVLSAFHYEIPKPLSEAPWIISLGVEYDPAVPLDVSLMGLSAQLNEIPQGMRGMQNDIDTASENMVSMSDGMIDVAYDLDLIREQVADVNPQLEIIITDLVKVKVSAQTTQLQIPKTLDKIGKWWTAVMSLAIITQIPSIYFSFITVWNERKETHN
jgi:hypothetical protein